MFIVLSNFTVVPHTFANLLLSDLTHLINIKDIFLNCVQLLKIMKFIYKFKVSAYKVVVGIGLS